jgi:peptide/nickel transport system permease protein
VRLLGLLARRLALSALALVAITVLTYGLVRVLRPERYGGESVVGGTAHDVNRALLHLDFGHACRWPGCPPIHDMWTAGVAADLWLLGGGLLVGVVVGVAAGLWCAARPRSLPARVLEGAAMVVYCTPVYVSALLLLLLFNPAFGRLWHLPGFFDAAPESYVPPWVSPWDWLRAYLVPSIVLGAPIAAACLRLMLAHTIEELDRHYVRTAWAKGLRRRRVIRRHAAPPAYLSLGSYIWGALPMVVTNVVLVEWVFDVPGFLKYAKRALGQDKGFPGMDIPMLQAIALWSGVLIVLLSMAVDVATAVLDPRVRAATGPARTASA